MKRWTYFLFIQTIALTLFATDPKVKLTWSDEYQLPKNHKNLGFIGSPDIGYTQIGHEYGKSLSLQKFSPTLKLENEKLISLKDFPKDYFSEYFLEWNNKHYWFYTTWDKGEGKERLFVQSVDAAKGDLSGTAKEIISCEELRGEMYNVGPYKYRKGDKFIIKFSSDKSKMFVYACYLEPVKEDRRGYKVYGLWVFDKDMNVIWSKPKVKMPHGERLMIISDIYADDDGSFLFLSKVYDSEMRAVVITNVGRKTTNIKDKQPEFHYKVIRFSDKENGTIQKFEFKDKCITEIGFTRDVNNNLTCVGYYSNRDENGQLTAFNRLTDGCFIKRLTGPDQQSLEPKFYDIPTTEDLNLRKVIFNADGSIVFIGEEYFAEEERYRTGDQLYTNTKYYYQNVKVQYIDKDGKQSWVKKIPKSQYGFNSDWGLGIRHIDYKGISYLFFLDNLVLTQGQSPARHTAGWGGVLMAVRLDETGSMKKSIVFDTREVKNSIDIMDADLVGEGMLIDRTQFGTSPYAVLRPNTPSKICIIKVEE